MEGPLRVRLVTSWQTAGCGIEEHSRMLIEAVKTADAEIGITPDSAALDPDLLTGKFDLLHLNAQASLHSRWSSERIRVIRATDRPVLVTWHDTGVPNSDHCKAIIDAADAAVVHEPFDDLPEEKTRYWRMGVPESRGLAPLFPSWHMTRPTLGTVGFPFPWKCYDELAKVTASVGWGLRLIAPGATDDDYTRWKAINPWLSLCREFAAQGAVEYLLAGCDATAFTYVTHNTGQSGAILQGIAVGKPVFALRTCRQMRALLADPLGRRAIHWTNTFEELGERLSFLLLGRLDTGIVALREQESWRHLGKKYAALYRELAGR